MHLHVAGVIDGDELGFIEVEYFADSRFSRYALPRFITRTKSSAPSARTPSAGTMAHITAHPVILIWFIVATRVFQSPVSNKFLVRKRQRLRLPCPALSDKLSRRGRRNGALLLYKMGAACAE